MKIKAILNRLILVPALSLITSCSGGPGTKVSVAIRDQFPEIKVKGPEGKLISFISPDDSNGSIGYVSDGEVTWISGMPQKSKSGKESISFIWDNGDGNSIVMTARIIEGDISFTISQAGEIRKDISSWLLNLDASPDEYFTGIFERVVDGHQNNSWADSISTALNLRGQKVDVKLKPTVSAYAPFYISSRNYGFFAAGTWPGVIDFCSENAGAVKISFEGPEFSFKIYTAGNPMDIVRKHALETGPSFMPPAWAFGPWRWRDEHFNNAAYYDGTPKKAPYNTDIVEDVLMMKAFDIPFTAYWIDRPWATGNNGFDDYEWDTGRFTASHLNSPRKSLTCHYLKAMKHGKR